MAKIVEIGPYHSIDPQNWGENYSERRSLERMEWEMKYDHGFRFSFEEHLKVLKKYLGNPTLLRVLDGGCGEGTALWQLAELGRKLGIQMETTGVTKDPRHKDGLVGIGVDEVVIGTVQNFFATHRRKNHYQFILDYAGALSSDYSEGVQGATIVPIYRRIIDPRGTALLSSSPVASSLLERNGLKVIRGTSGCVLVSRI